jgi:hypothetical protein
MAVWHYNFYIDFKDNNTNEEKLLNDLYDLYNEKSINDNQVIV